MRYYGGLIGGVDALTHCEIEWQLLDTYL
jgi:hypothetical protein